MEFDKNFVTTVLPNVSIAFGHFPNETTFSIDSRKVLPSDIFVALKGAHKDGHDFVAEAFKNGAAGCIIDQTKKDLLNNIKDLEKKVVLLVPDPLDAFVALASAWRSQFKYPVIAITGSVGKTSTKELLSRIMLQCGKQYFGRRFTN